MTSSRWPGRRTEAIALLLILLVAAAFRLYRLDDIPPGFTHDEAGHGLDAIAILNGARPLYETVGYGREPFYDYVVALLMPIFGPHYLTLRLASALAGLLLINVTHLWVRRAFDVPTALLTSALLAVSFWAISTDRQALRSALLPALFTVSVYFSWRGFRPHRPWSASGESASGDASYNKWFYSKWFNYVMAGLVLGLSLYTYMAARALPGVFVLLWLYLLIFHRSTWKQNGLGIVGMVVLGTALSLPMFAYLSANAGAEARLTQLSGPIDRLFAGDPSEVLGNALSALGMFTLKGDNLWLYNIPDRPLLDGVTSTLFYLGVIVAIRRFRRTEYALALFWLLLGIFPSLLTGVVASNLRSIAAQPVVYLFAAVGVVEAIRGLGRLVQPGANQSPISSTTEAQKTLRSPLCTPCLRGSKLRVDFRHALLASRTLRALPLAAWIAAVAVSAAHDYFAIWGQARDVRVAYHTTLFEIARYLDREAQPQSVVAISSIYPNRFHDPYSMEMTLHRNDLSLRWFTGSFVDMTGAPHASLIFPAVNPAKVTEPSQGRPLVIVQSIAPIDPIFAQTFARRSEQIDSVELRPDDFNSRFDVYGFDSEGALADVLAAGVALSETADFGHTLELIGYDIRTPQVRPGETVVVITLWRIISTFDREAVLFTHVLTGNPDRPVLAQQDSLDVPVWYWTPGDAFAQVHRFVTPADAAPGVYPLEAGIYTREDAARLPVYDRTGAVVSDHVVVGSLEVQAP